MNNKTIEQRVIEWLLSDDTGDSSKSICRHMMLNEGCGPFSYPSDPADLGRCLRLLARIPEWEDRIGEMTQNGPGWAGQVAVWWELEKTMRDEVGIDWSKGQSAPITYAAMKKAQANGYKADKRWACTFRHDGTMSSATFIGDGGSDD